LFTSLQSSVISAGVLRTGLKTIFTGINGEESNAAAMAAELEFTCSSVLGPYKCWLPVINQTSYCFKVVLAIILMFKNGVEL
jgi:hypothetical protein